MGIGRFLPTQNLLLLMLTNSHYKGKPVIMAEYEGPIILKLARDEHHHVDIRKIKRLVERKPTFINYFITNSIYPNPLKISFLLTLPDMISFTLAIEALRL